MCGVIGACERREERGHLCIGQSAAQRAVASHTRRAFRPGSVIRTIPEPVLIWDRRKPGYDLGGKHPLHPLRWKLTLPLAQTLCVVDGFDLVAPFAADVDTLALVHTMGYIDAVRRASRPGRVRVLPRFGPDGHPIGRGARRSRRLPLPDGVGQVGHSLRRIRADLLQGHAARVHALEQADSGAEQYG